MSIESHLFPLPDAYNTNGVGLDRFAHLSILAFHIQLVSAGGNLFKGEVKKGFYFFRNDSIPLPRPATQLAWERVCRIGKLESTLFLVPFLPALREEDESGLAIAERGTHLASLSRRSPLHHKELATIDGKSFEFINWGPCYFGRIPADENDVTMHGTLESKMEYSNIVEARVAKYHDQSPDTSQESIRMRMEFFAQNGIPATNGMARKLGMPRIHRLLFQFLTQRWASHWADAYRDSYRAIRKDTGLIDADYKDMIESIKNKKVKETQEGEEKAKKESTKKQDFGKLSF